MRRCLSASGSDGRANGDANSGTSNRDVISRRGGDGSSPSGPVQMRLLASTDPIARFPKP